MAPPNRARLVRFAGGALLVALAVRAALPFAIELAAESVGTDLFGRRVEIEDVDLALLSGGLIVERVAVGPLGRAGEPPPEFAEGEGHFTLSRLTANLGWLGLLRGEIHLESVGLVEPGWLMLRDAEGRLVPVLLPREEVAVEEVPEEEPGSGPVVRLDLLAVTDLDARFVNLARPDRLPLHFELAELRVERLERRGEQLALGGIGLRAPSLRVLRDIDLSFVANPEAAAEPVVDGAEIAAAATAPEEAAAVAPPDLRLTEVNVETARFLLVTEEGEVATTLAFHGEGVTLEPGATFPIRATLGIEEGEIVLEGVTGAFPPVFAGTLTWQALPLATIGDAAGALSPLLFDAGSSSGELRIDARVGDDEPPRVGVSGRVAVDGLAVRDRSGAMTLGWSGLEVGLQELDLDPGGERPPRVSLSRIALATPRARIVRQAGAPAEAAAEAKPDGAPAGDASGDATAPTPQPELSLAQLEITGGELEFVDETVAPVHTSKLANVQVKAAGLRLPEQQADSLAVSFTGPGEASFALDASVSGSAGRAHVELAQLALPAFSPYAAEASGYWVEAGLLSLEADVAADGTKTKFDSDVDLVKLDVAEVEPGSFEKQFGVPVDLGLALLRDPGGRIGLPIRATLADDGTGVDLAPILVAALRQAIVGALTAPLKTAGLLLPGDDGPGGLRLDPVPMAPGSAEPSVQDMSSLSRFAGILASRPGLGLELHGALAPEDDAALAQQILAEQVVADAKLPPVDAGFLQRRRLRGALKERAEGGAGQLEAEDREALDRWVAAVEVPDERREQLALARAEAVRDVLVSDHRVDRARVRIGDPTEGAPGVVVGLAPAKR